MDDSDIPVPFRIWVGIIATGLWLGAVSTWGIGWLIKQVRER